MTFHRAALLLISALLFAGACNDADPGDSSPDTEDAGNGDTVEDTDDNDVDVDDGGDDVDPNDAADTADTDDVSDVQDVDDVSDVQDASDVSDVSDVQDATDTSDATDTDADADAVDVLDVDPAPEFTAYCPTITNNGAETNNLNGWTVGRGEWDVATEGEGFPTAFENTPFGSRYFYGGEAGNSEAYQDIDVSDDAEAIDYGGVIATLRAHLGSDSGDDEATLQIFALDEDDAELAMEQSGPWSSDNWVERQTAIELPSGTRTLRVQLKAKRNTGIDNDAYFDEISLCMSREVATIAPDEFAAPPYLMWVTEDAVTVMFETQQSLRAVVEYGTTPELGLRYEEVAPVQMHEARLQGLPADSIIYYRVRWGAAATETWSFRTAPPADTSNPISFVFWGDNQDGPDKFATIVSRMIALEPDIALSGGDIVQYGKRSNYRDEWLGPVFGLGNQTPMMVTIGNHEHYLDFSAVAATIISDELSWNLDTALPNWERYVSLPGMEHCFGWGYGPLHFIFVNTERDFTGDTSFGEAQAACIQEVINSPGWVNAELRIGIWHHPPRIEHWTGGLITWNSAMEQPDVRSHLEPLLVDAGINFIMNGHNHLMNHSPPHPDDGQPHTLVTSGGGGGGLEEQGGFLPDYERDWPEVETQIFGQHHFLHGTYEDGVLSIDAINIDGNVIHSFTVNAPN